MLARRLMGRIVSRWLGELVTELVEMDDGNFQSSPQNGNIDLVRNVKSHPFDERFQKQNFKLGPTAVAKQFLCPSQI